MRDCGRPYRKLSYSENRLFVFRIQFRRNRRFLEIKSFGKLSPSSPRALDIPDIAEHCEFKAVCLRLELSVMTFKCELFHNLRFRTLGISWSEISAKSRVGSRVIWIWVTFHTYRILRPESLSECFRSGLRIPPSEEHSPINSNSLI